MALGVTDLKNVIRIPGNWDLDYLRKFNGTEGTRVSFDELIRTTGAAFTMFNNSLNQGYWSRYITPTTNITADDDMGNDGGELPELAEYTRNAPVTADSTGHMIPMKDYGRELDWTYWAIRRGTNPALSRNVRVFIEQAQNTWEKRLLTRLFKSTYDAVGTGRSVPFADGGVADDGYIPPSTGGYTFDTTHTHYLRYADTAAGRAGYLDAAGLHLRHHGINGPYDLVIPEGDVADWAALDGTNGATWIKPKRDGIDTANVQVRALFDTGDYIAAIETNREVFLVKPTNRVSADHAGVFKPMGYGSPFNPLAVRYEAGYPMGLTLLVDRPGTFPVQGAQGIFTFGTGVQNRLNGVLGYFAASGAYSDPVIS